MSILNRDYPHFTPDLSNEILGYEKVATETGYDSIRAEYSDGQLLDFYGCGPEFAHIHIRYYEPDTTVSISFNDVYRRKGIPTYARPLQPEVIGQYNRDGQRIREWKHYLRNGILSRTENYLVPWDEPDGVALGSAQSETNGS